MALQLQWCGEWSHDALRVVFKPPGEKNGHSRKTRLRAYTDDGLSLSLLNNEAGRGSSPKLTPSERWKGLPVATPRFSSFLRLTRRRRHELRMETRDRVYLSISDWVFRRVKDPLVEIDPVTVNEAIIAEQAEEGGPLVSTATSTSPSLFGYLPPGFPRSANRRVVAAAILLLLLALITAAILALRGRKKSAIGPLEPRPQEGGRTGSVNNGGAREDVDSDRSPSLQEVGDLNTSFVDSESDKAVRRRPHPVLPPSFEPESTSFRPIPQYSTALEQSDLPLPPSLSFSAGTKGKTPPDPIEKIDPPTEEVGGSPADDRAVLTVADEIISSNGVMNANSTVDIADELETFAIGEMDASALVEEVTTAALAIEENLVDESLIEESSTAVSTVNEALLSASEPIVDLPSVAEPHPQLPEEYCEDEYILIGESDSLSPIGKRCAPAEPIAVLQAAADVGRPVDSIVVGNSATESTSEDLPSELIGLVSTAAAQEGVSVGSTHFEEPNSQPSMGTLQVGIEEATEERHKEYNQVLEKVLPAVSVGAGVAALSSLSGVDGALEVVGVLATASFLTRDIIWAGPRQQLLDDIRNIKDHKQLVEFLKDKKIIPKSWSH